MNLHSSVLAAINSVINGYRPGCLLAHGFWWLNVYITRGSVLTTLMTFSISHSVVMPWRPFTKTGREVSSRLYCYNTWVSFGEWKTHVYRGRSTGELASLNIMTPLKMSLVGFHQHRSDPMEENSISWDLSSIWFEKRSITFSIATRKKEKFRRARKWSQNSELQFPQLVFCLDV